MPSIIAYLIYLRKKLFELTFSFPDLKELAVLEYELPRKGVMDMTHTGVPVALRGRGIAGLLAKVLH